MTNISKKSVILDYIVYIYYLVHFKENSNNFKALIDFDYKINIITPTYTIKLGLQIQKTDVKAQNINKSSF